MTECPICYDNITDATGSAKLSCGHCYHISCISTWFLRQDGASCAMCRKEMGPLETVQHASEADTDDEEEEEEEEERYSPEAELAAALARERYVALGDAAAVAAATKIQSIYRMIVLRDSYETARQRMWDVKLDEEYLLESKRKAALALAILIKGKDAVKIEALTKLQARWRGRMTRTNIIMRTQFTVVCQN